MNATDVDRVRVTAEFDRGLVRDQGNSVRYLGVSVTAPATTAAAARQQPPLNLAIVIDASGSMSGGKLEAAKLAAIGLVERLRPCDILTVVSFASEIVTHTEPLPLEAGNKGAALEAISGLHTRGNTYLSGGWLRGAELVRGYLATHPGCHNRVLLLSDGHANEGITDPQELGHQAEGLSGQGIYSSAVGIGSDYSSSQLEAIAVNGAGQLHRATTPQEIVEVVMGELGDIAATVAENISVEVRFPPGARVELIGDFPVLQGQQQVRCQLGALIAAATRLAIFKVTAPAGAAGSQLPFDASVRWNLSGSREMLAAEAVPAVLSFAHEIPTRAQPRQLALSVEVARVWQGTVLRQAVRLNRDGRYKEASQLLEQELHHFQRYCEGLPQTAPLVQEMQLALGDISHAWDEGRRKEAEIRGWKQTRQERDHRRGS